MIRCGDPEREQLKEEEDSIGVSVLLKPFLGKGYYLGWFTIAFAAVVWAGVCNLFRVSVIAHQRFEDTDRGVFFNVHQLMVADGTPSLTSIRGTAHTLMN